MSHKIGLASEERLKLMEEKKDKSEAFVQFFKDTSVIPEVINPILESKDSALVKQSDKLFKAFSRPNISMEDMQEIDFVADYVAQHNLDHEVLQQTEVQIKYAGYIAKEKNNADKLNRLEGIKIPEGFDYTKLKSLSYEAREKLSNIRPVTVSQASRISGVSPNDISVMLVYMGR
jgi:tRNA uridine 5-carboxymethylaminomethyl modification enzyme